MIIYRIPRSETRGLLTIAEIERLERDWNCSVVGRFKREPDLVNEFPVGVSDEMQEWLDLNIGGAYRIDIHPLALAWPTIEFDEERDAVAYRLRWT